MRTKKYGKNKSNRNKIKNKTMKGGFSIFNLFSLSQTPEEINNKKIENLTKKKEKLVKEIQQITAQINEIDTQINTLKPQTEKPLSEKPVSEKPVTERQLPQG
jgi:peptidoglycan hydrolase CwlO-like protein